jgi:hypothetical protein
MLVGIVLRGLFQDKLETILVSVTKGRKKCDVMPQRAWKAN